MLIATKRYRTIVVDPPWILTTGPTLKFGSGGIFARGRKGQSQRVPFPTLTIDEITKLPIADLSESNAHLYLWTTNAYVRDAYDILRCWEFRPAQLLTWCKPPHGLGPGGAFVSTTEHCIFARRGTLAHQRRIDSTWWLWPRRVGPPVLPGRDRRTMHSAKPEHFYDLVEQVSPGPYVELFARRHRLGWDVWGDESANTATLEFGSYNGG